MARAPDVLAQHGVPPRGGSVRIARSCAVASTLCIAEVKTAFSMKSEPLRAAQIGSKYWR